MIPICPPRLPLPPCIRTLLPPSLVRGPGMLGTREASGGIGTAGWPPIAGENGCCACANGPGAHWVNPHRGAVGPCVGLEPLFQPAAFDCFRNKTTDPLLCSFCDT